MVRLAPTQVQDSARRKHRASTTAGWPSWPGQPLSTITEESRGELDYTLPFANGNPDFIQVAD